MGAFSPRPCPRQQRALERAAQLPREPSVGRNARGRGVLAEGRSTLVSGAAAGDDPGLSERLGAGAGPVLLLARGTAARGQWDGGRHAGAQRHHRIAGRGHAARSARATAGERQLPAVQPAGEQQRPARVAVEPRRTLSRHRRRKFVDLIGHAVESPVRQADGFVVLVADRGLRTRDDERRTVSCRL
jgi:hypothetical protein